LGTCFAVDYGPVFLEWKNDRKDKFNWYILPDSLGVELALIGNGHKFSLEDSVKYGTPIFYSKDESPKEHDGLSYSNNIFLNREREGKKLMRHEFNHTLQDSSFYPFGEIMLNTFNKTSEISNELKEMHINVAPCVGSSLRGLDNLFNSYKNKFFEREAYGLTGE
jgi:hypothetical protein